MIIIDYLENGWDIDIYQWIKVIFTNKQNYMISLRVVDKRLTDMSNKGYGVILNSLPHFCETLWDYLETCQYPTHKPFIFLVIKVKYIHCHVGEAPGCLFHPSNCTIWLFWQRSIFSPIYKPYIVCSYKIHVLACHTCAMGNIFIHLVLTPYTLYTYFILLQPTRWCSRLERTPPMRKVGCSNPKCDWPLS